MIDGQLYDAKKYYETIANGGVSLPAYYSYDATNIRIQELSLTYRLPLNEINKMKWLKSLSMSVTGYNLAMLYLKAPFDPESTVNTRGYSNTADFFRMPSLRSLGISIKAAL